MKNSKTNIFVAGITFTLAFSFGIAAWKHQPVSLCTVTEYRLHFQPLKGDNYVNLKGYLYGGEILSFSDTKLNACEGSAAEVILADEGKLSYESLELIRKLRLETDISKVRGSDHEDKFARAEVELVGTLSEREQYCFTSRYVITAEEITPTGSVEVIDRSTLTKEIQKAR